MTKTNNIRVDLGSRSYDIIIGAGLIESAPQYIALLQRDLYILIVTDETVASLYLKKLEQALNEAHIRHASIILPPGESTKSFRMLERLMRELLRHKPDRQTMLLALGGGVIGDITGFAASILLRGVDFIQIPTTLLSQVDSSVGGKTGINMRAGKNLVGTFHQPRLVLADVSALSTLPRREVHAGYAEVVKYGIIGNVGFFAWLEENGAIALEGNTQALMYIVQESCKAKAAIVTADEREGSLRAILNFGHTFGHALEAQAGYNGVLLHGEAVSIGMVLAMQLSVKKGLCAEEDYQRLRQHLINVGLPVSPRDIDIKWDIKGLIKNCYQDKKATKGKLTFILAEKIGKVTIYQNVNKEEIEALLAEALEIR